MIKPIDSKYIQDRIPQDVNNYFKIMSQPFTQEYEYIAKALIESIEIFKGKVAISKDIYVFIGKDVFEIMFPNCVMCVKSTRHAIGFVM